jgi:chemotaxis signal transduction protein
MAEIAPDNAVELACIVIPVGEQNLVLPNECVAEVLPWRSVRPQAGAPAWCAGTIRWRGEQVVVARFATLNDTPLTNRIVDRCIVVLNRACSAGQPKFYALAASGLPRALQLQEGDVVNRGDTLGSAEVAAVNVGMEQAVIPHLEVIEGAIRALVDL